MIERIPLEQAPDALAQSFPAFTQDIMLEALENKHKLRHAEDAEAAAGDDGDDEQADVEREVTRLLSERRPRAPAERRRRRRAPEPARASDDEAGDASGDEAAPASDGGRAARRGRRDDDEAAPASDDGSRAAADEQSSSGGGDSESDGGGGGEDDDDEPADDAAAPKAPVKDKKTLLREEREDLLWQLKKLERSKMTVPVVDNCTSVEELRRIIKDVRRESIFDSNITSLKTLLITLLHGVEWVGTQKLGLNLTGFAEHEQLYRMDEYDRHLIALSDRAYLGWSEDLPPEMCMVAALATNTGLYLLQNKKTAAAPTRRMQGPSSII